MSDIKIAMLFPYAPSYREAIYRKMDTTFDIHWFFAGNAKRNLRLLDYSILRSCNLDMSEEHFIGPITFYKGLKHLGIDKYDVLIIAGVIKCISEWILLLRYGRRRKGPRVLLWTHGWYGKESWFQRKVKKLFFSFADGLLLYGNYAKAGLAKLGIEENRLFVIHNSLDYEAQLAIREQISSSSIYKDHFKNTYPILVFLGRLTKVKNLDMILEAVSILRREGKNVNVVFVGDGEMKDALQAQADSLGISDRVWFYGESFDEKRNAELLYNADMCVAPGNVGLTAMHSLMFGCPVLTHDDFRWQMPEFEAIQEGITGSFFKRNDILSLTTQISSWLDEHNNEREFVRQACYKEIDNSWNPAYQIKVINEVLECVK